MPPTEPSTSWPVSDVIIDSSVAVAWALPDEHLHPAAMRFIDQVGVGRLEPVVAAHFAFEVRHALVRAARAGRIAWSTIPQWLAAIESLDATIVPLRAEDHAILALAERHVLTWGDAHWVQIASDLDRPLVTVDRRLARAVPDEVAIVVYLGDEEVA